MPTCWPEPFIRSSQEQMCIRDRKQIIRKRLCIVILTAMLTTLLINYYIEIHNAQNEMYTSAREMFWQVGQILDQNEKEAEKERENLKEQCFIRAKAIAYLSLIHI